MGSDTRRFQINPGPLKLRGEIPKPVYRYRDYKALEVDCPRCGAAAGIDCHRDNGEPMRGVHRARDLSFNRREARREAARQDRDAKDRERQ